MENRDEFQSRVVEAVRELSVSNEFANWVEEITERVNILRKLFPELGTADMVLAEQPVLVGAEGWFAIPRWEKIAAN